MLQPGTRIGHYEVQELLGTGGMGEVYRARDTRLGRDVALKVLSDRVTLDAPRYARFEHEARLLGSLNHPNIATVHGIEDFGDSHALILEFVPGQTLADQLGHGPVALPDALTIAEQIAAALDAAHERGIVHRDLKPANVQLRSDGMVKLLDFGIAKVFAPAPGEASVNEDTVTLVTDEHPPIVGTPAYMSPEQARGLPVDRRTDVWAFGCVLYELLTHRRAFPGERLSDVIAKVIEREPDFEALPATIPPAVRRLLERCLAKDVRRRLRDMGDARLEIEEIRNALAPSRTTGTVVSADRRENRSHQGPRTLSTRIALGAIGAVTLLTIALAGALYWFFYQDRDRRWLTEEVIPQIEKHLDVADWEPAYALAREADARVPDSPELAELWTRISWRVTIPSEPPGATVYRQAYLATGDDWEVLGQTPLENIRIPYGLSRLRFELEGHRPLVRAIGGGHLNWSELTGGTQLLDSLLVGPETYRLDTEHTLPTDKVRVPGWSMSLGGETLKLDDFFIGRHEVTNAEFKMFVDAGGYARADLWEPVLVNSAPLAFDSAVARFTDRTGRPGPSTWEAGDYPEGWGGHPVTGVSWYEASAYARFKGEELPTAYHWHQALANSMFPWLLPISNFGREGPRPVADSHAMSYVAAFDLPGNVREWTANALGDERVILGGSWNDPYYIVGASDTSAPPLDRSPGNGIRLAVTRDSPTVALRVRAPVVSRSAVSPVLGRRPASDETYDAYGRMFDYGRGPLNASVVATSATRVWARERIEFNAGYGTERMLLHLYLPSSGAPPYQTVVYWPGWDTLRLDDVDGYFAKQVDFIVKSGRAVAFPIYRGSFERRVGDARALPDFNTTAYRDNVLDTVKDLRRTIDYLETRQDVDAGRLAFFGYSWGGVNGPAALAQEPRLKLAVINIGMLPPMESIPEVDPLHALPRVRVPVLMLSGEFDPLVPVHNARRYFELIGAKPAEKRHVIALGGHYIPRDLVIRESLDWLDRHLGPARR
jgi:eukaryotic-like serine/threonine-protein kinase